MYRQEKDKVLFRRSASDCKVGTGRGRKAGAPASGPAGSTEWDASPAGRVSPEPGPLAAAAGAAPTRYGVVEDVGRQVVTPALGIRVRWLAAGNKGRRATQPGRTKIAGPRAVDLLAALALAAAVFYLTFHVIQALGRGWPLVLR